MAKKKTHDSKLGTVSSDDITSDSSSNESTDNDDVESNEYKSEKNSESKAVIPEDFKLSCLHKSDEHTLSSCLKTYLEMSKQSDNKRGPHHSIRPYSTSNFIPWWEEFTKLKHRTNVTSEPESLKDDDRYDSWFDKNATHGSNWLCGSSSSASTTAQTEKTEVEDTQVPSIYDNRPAPKGRRALKRERRAERAKDLGKKWFGMKAPDVDEDLKNDMELIRMRSVLDPKRFYKHQDRKALPKYFQMGTVVDEGTDFYSSRLTKKQRKQTLVEELMADANIRQYNKKKYAELQQKMRGKKKFKSKHPKN